MVHFVIKFFRNLQMGGWRLPGCEVRGWQPGGWAPELGAWNWQVFSGSSGSETSLGPTRAPLILNIREMLFFW